MKTDPHYTVCEIIKSPEDAAAVKPVYGSLIFIISPFQVTKPHNIQSNARILAARNKKVTLYFKLFLLQYNYTFK